MLIADLGMCGIIGYIGNRNAVSVVLEGLKRLEYRGKPSEENAHPHRSDGIVLVHNGIIENYLSLKKKLIEKGYTFTSETDTEVLCHLIEAYAKSYPLEDAVREALKEVKGAYAIAVIKEDEPDKIVGVRKDSPLVIGLGEGESFIASDIPAFISYSRDVIFLDNGEMAVLTENGVKITGLDGIPLHKNAKNVSWSPSMAE